MKIKKLLNEERKKIDNKIIEENQDLYNSLVENHDFSDTDKKTKISKVHYKKWLISITCVVVVCLVVGLGVGLTRPKLPEYFYQNEVGEGCSLDEIELSTNKSFSLSDNYVLPALNKMYDSVTGDTLYYRIAFEHKTDFTDGNLYIVVNQYYKYPEQHLGEIKQTQLNGYEVEYSVDKTIIEDIPINNYFGCVYLSKFKIYFQFEELNLDETTTPQKVLEELIIFK